MRLHTLFFAKLSGLT